MAFEFNDGNFEAEVLQAEGLVVVDFSATWCQPCKLVAPIIDQLAEEYAGKAKIGKADLDETQNFAMQNDIQGVPTVVIFKGGQEVARHSGVQAKAVYQKDIDANI